MKKDFTANIEQRKGTIANVLNAHKDELYELLDCGDIAGCREKAIDLLDDESITDKTAVAKAKQIFKRPNDNLFLSCLVTYMTGMKVA